MHAPLATQYEWFAAVFPAVRWGYCGRPCNIQCSTASAATCVEPDCVICDRAAKLDAVMFHEQLQLSARYLLIMQSRKAAFCHESRGRQLRTARRSAVTGSARDPSALWPVVERFAGTEGAARGSSAFASARTRLADQQSRAKRQDRSILELR